MFSREVEVRLLRSLTPFREFSSTFVRLFSISAALAPGYEDITMMVFASNSGSCAMDVFTSEKMPNIMNAMNTRAVVTGWFTDDL